MRTWITAGALLVLAAAPVWAKDLALPKKDPAITVTIPNAWNPEIVENEIQSQSPGSDVALNVAFSARGDFDAVIKDSKDYLRGHKVNLSVKPSEQTIDFSGTPGQVQRYRTTDENGKTVVDLITLEASRDRRVLITVWGSETERQARENELGAIMKSVRIPAGAGGPASFWSGGEAKDSPARAPQAETPKAGVPVPVFAVRRALFVTRKAAGQGDVAARDSAVFTPGEEILAYVEPSGIVLTKVEPGKRRFGIGADMQLRTRDGVVLIDKPALAGKELFYPDDGSELPIYINMSLDLPMTAGPGDSLVVAYTLHDRESGQTAKAELPFTVGPSTGSGPCGKPEVRTLLMDSVNGSDAFKDGRRRLKDLSEARMVGSDQAAKSLTCRYASLWSEAQDAGPVERRMGMTYTIKDDGAGNFDVDYVFDK